LRTRSATRFPPVAWTDEFLSDTRRSKTIAVSSR
jgi:hypothetical protein